MPLLHGAKFLIRFREKLIQTIGSFMELIGVLSFFSFFIAILIQIFTRYVMHHPLQWTEEIARLFYIGMIFLGAAVAVDEHFRLRLGIDFIEKHCFVCYRMLSILIDIITMIVLYYFTVGSYNRIIAGWTMIMPATGFRQSFFYIPLLIGSGLLILYTLLHFFAQILGPQKEKEI